MKKKTVEISRDSRTGRFVTKQYADTHKPTTQTEHRPKPKKK